MKDSNEYKDCGGFPRQKKAVKAKASEKLPGISLDSRFLGKALRDLWQQSCDPKTLTFDRDLYTQKLVSYIVRRDHQIYNHAFHNGKLQADAQSKVSKA